MPHLGPRASPRLLCQLLTLQPWDPAHQVTNRFPGLPVPFISTLATAFPNKLQGRQKQVLAVLTKYAEALPSALPELHTHLPSTSSDRRRRILPPGDAHINLWNWRTSRPNSYQNARYKPAQGLLKDLNGLARQHSNATSEDMPRGAGHRVLNGYPHAPTRSSSIHNSRKVGAIYVSVQR